MISLIVPKHVQLSPMLRLGRVPDVILGVVTVVEIASEFE
jgi:hypothetical protein